MAREKAARLCGIFAAAMMATSSTAQANQIDFEDAAPWEVCALCHALDGLPPMARFPRLAGQRPDYIIKQVRDIRHGRRDNDGGQMQAIVTEVEDSDLAAIAAWFASQPAPEPSAPDGDAEAGAVLFAAKGCGGCHRAAPPSGLTPPHIAAQHERYLAKQLADFRDGRRGNDPDGVMRAVASGLTDADIASLAAYLASTSRD